MVVLIGGRNISTFGPKYQSYTPYQKMRVQRYVMQQAAQKAIANIATFSSNMFGAKISHGQGLTELAIQAASQRTVNAANAKRQELLKSIDVSV